MTRAEGNPAVRAWAHRWVHLLLGAALALAFLAVAAWPLELLSRVLPAAPAAVAGTLLVLVPVALVGTMGEVRRVEGAAVAALLTGGVPQHPQPATTWRQRGRTSLLFLLHVVAGGACGALLVVGAPVAALLVAAAAGSSSAAAQLTGLPVPQDAGARLAVAAALVAVTAAGGELLGRVLVVVAPRLLRDPAGERLAAAEAHVSVLAGRDRLARELHDSVGHSLSLVSIQAGAARRLLTRDPTAAESALRAAEDASRRALVDLDHVLGLLREETGGTPAAAPVPDLRDLDALVAAAGAAGTRVEPAVRGDVGALPAVVSREAYRIVQEALTNALRHAPGGACLVAVDAAGDDLVLDVRNTAPGGTAAAGRAGARPGGGRGLAGVRERVLDLRGSLEAGPGPDGTWRLVARLPVRARGTSRWGGS
ncbi:hypothetical protein NUM3379_42690 [Kineococcus sp. NUM-3379]